jgi:hypothetical protein
MKKFSTGLIAIALAIFLNGFSINIRTTGKFASIYLIYDCSGSTCAISNYFQQTRTPPNCIGSTVLCWIRVTDLNGDGVISQSELTSFCTAHDTDHDGSLNDEVEIAGVLEKQTSC